MLESFLYEVDDDKIIKYRDKDGESQEMTAGAAKKMDKDHPAKVAWDKMDAKEKGGDDVVKGKKLGKGDFDTTGGMADEPPYQRDRDKEAEDDFYDNRPEIDRYSYDDNPFSNDPDVEDYEDYGKYKDYDVLGGYKNDDKLSDIPDDDEYENMQDEIIKIAAEKYNVDGDEISPDFKNSTDREEFNSGETFKDMIDMAEKFAREEAERQADYEDMGRDFKPYNYDPRENIKVINGKKYKAIKEEKTLKEQYDRLFTNRTVI